MKRLHVNGGSAKRAPHLWLAAQDGRRLTPPAGVLPPIDQPERPIEVEFVGLSEVEQLRALAAFPGGRRFVLKQVGGD